MIAGKLLLNVKILYNLRWLLKYFPYQPDKIHLQQLIKLKKLVVYAYENFEFYRERMDRVNFNPYQVTELDDLKILPLLTKEEYRNFVETVVQKNPHKYQHYYIDKTSGSTGFPMKVYRTWNERAYMVAKFLRALFANGYKYTDRVYSTPSPLRAVKRDSIIQHLGFLQRYNVFMTETPEKIVKGYIDSKADIFYANKSQIVQMALYIEENGIKVHKPKFYISSAETLDPASRALMENAFGKNFVEVYGAVEFNNLGFQKLGNDYFYFNHDTDILELEKDGQAQPNEGYCIITDLHIYSFPLIRYRLGDYLETTEKDGLTVIRAIKGRIDDCAILRDGTRRPYGFFYIAVCHMTEIKQIRFIQETYDLVVVEVALKPDADKAEFEKNLIQGLKSKVSDQLEYKVVYKKALDPDPSGKIRILISKVDAGLS